MQDRTHRRRPRDIVRKHEETVPPRNDAQTISLAETCYNPSSVILVSRQREKGSTPTCQRCDSAPPQLVSTPTVYPPLNAAHPHSLLYLRPESKSHFQGPGWCLYHQPPLNLQSKTAKQSTHRAPQQTTPGCAPYTTEKTSEKKGSSPAQRADPHNAKSLNRNSSKSS